MAASVSRLIFHALFVIACFQVLTLCHGAPLPSKGFDKTDAELAMEMHKKELEQNHIPIHTEPPTSRTQRPSTNSGKSKNYLKDPVGALLIGMVAVVILAFFLGLCYQYRSKKGK